jgi:DNA-binding NtrC family response regulator
MASRRGTVLVVDDNPDARKSLLDVLSSAGYEVLTADGGPAAFALLQRNKSFEVAIVDYNMPDFDGFQVAAKIREILPACRIIMFTIEPTIETENLSVASGLYYYLPKSTWFSILIPTIERAMRGEPPPRPTERPKDYEKLVSQYEEEHVYELAAQACEARARELELAGQWEKAADWYVKAFQDCGKARGVASEYCKKYRFLAEAARRLGEIR